MNEENEEEYLCPKHSGERKECGDCTEEDIEEDRSNKCNMWIIGVTGLVCASLIWLALHWGLYWFGGGWEKASKMGDSFGSINALISGLAFIALTYTIHLQRKELGLQRKELAMTRDELSKSAEAQEAASQHQANLAKLEGLSTLLNKSSNSKNELTRIIDALKSRAASNVSRRAGTEHLSYEEMIKHSTLKRLIAPFTQEIEKLERKHTSHTIREKVMEDQLREILLELGIPTADLPS